jgi:hypothetical protein
MEEMQIRNFSFQCTVMALLDAAEFSEFLH